MKNKSINQVSIINGEDGPTSVFIFGEAQKQSLKIRIRNAIYQSRRKRIEKRSPRRFSPGRRPHRFLQRDHCICSLFRNGNGFSVSIPTTGTGLRSLFRPYIHLLYFNYAR